MRRPHSSKPHQKLVVSFLLICTFVLSTLLYTDLPRSAGAKEERAETKSAGSRLKQNTSTGCCGADDADKKPHVLAGSYYTLKDNFSAKLLLNNKGPTPIEVSPTLFSINGERFDAPAITVEPNSHQFENFNDWANIAGDHFREGSIQLFHRGKDLVLGAQIYLTNETDSLSFDEKLTELGKPGSSMLEGVWWLPAPKGAVKFLLSNTSDTTLSVSTIIRGKSPQREAETVVDVAPHETRVLDIGRDLLGREQGAMSSFGAISIEHNGGPGAILARAMALDATLGYSLPIQFLDPMKSKSNTLQGAGLRIGRAGRETLSPKVVAFNASETATTLSGRIPYTTTEGTHGEIILPHIQLSPRETEIIDIAPYVQVHGVSDNVAAAGVEFEYTGELGSIVTSVFSVSRTGSQVFRVPLWDIAAQRSATGGYPWYIEGESSTVVYIKNVTDAPRQYRMYLKHDAGDYVFPLTTVAPHQTTVVDIRRLRDFQVPDVNGQTIPLGQNRGQVQWSMTGGEDKVLIGRSEQADLARGVSSNYACQNCCGNSFYDGWIAPDLVAVFEGFEEQFTAMQQDINCYGQVYPAYQAGTPSFTSDDTSICESTFNGLATGIGPGSSIINAGWTADAWFMGLNEQCEYTPVQALREAICTVLGRDVHYRQVRFSNKIANFDSFYNASLDLGSAAGGGAACAGSASNSFTIYVDFDMPFGATSILHPNGNTFVTDNDNQQFRLVSFGFQNVEFTPTQTGTMWITLFRIPSKPSDRVDFRISGVKSGQVGIWSGSGRVHLQCP